MSAQPEGSVQSRRVQMFRALNASIERTQPLTLGNNQASVNATNLLDSKNHLSAKRITSLFTGGFVAAMAGRVVWKNLFKNNPASQKTAKNINNEFKTADILNDAKNNRTTELNIAQSFSEALSSIYMLALFDPQQRSALMGYIGASVLGYISANTAQGVQETWVRREETKVRAQLIDSMQSAFKDSFQQKQTFDNNLKQLAQREIYRLLLKHDVYDPHGMVTDKPLEESVYMNRQYMYEPTHRTVKFGSKDSNSELDRLLLSEPLGLNTNNPIISKGVKEAGVFGLGAVAGLAVTGFFKLFTTKGAQAKFGDKIVHYKTIHVKDLESWWIMATKGRKNAAVFGGFALMAGLGKLGKLFVDGLREIEVTRVNAKTEKMYQDYNWLKLDPSFHKIAEVESLRNELKVLDKELPYLKSNPARLKSQIQTMLTNIGRNSAPKYFPMTPGVNLVEARG